MIFTEINMEQLGSILIILLVCSSIFLITIIGFTLFSFALTSIIIYSKVFVRTNPSKWSRDVSSLSDKKQVQMYNEGVEWIKDYKDKLEDVDIYSDGFHLFGQYLNNNSDKTVIIIPGRTEGLIYSYYFAKPYYEEKFNVLFIDNRSHGLSDGRYIGLGLKEYKDIQNWTIFLKEKYNNKTIIIHGICIGAATGIYSLTIGEDRPCIAGIVTEGLYDNFYNSFKNHLIELKKPIFPFADLVMLLFRINVSVKPKKNGPIKYIDQVKCPILMLQSNTDIYSLPEIAGELYEKCGSKNKEIVYFEDAPHSMVRLYHKDKYDLVIKQFLKKNY